MPSETRKIAFVTGANGYIGNAVAKAFRRAGYKTFGLIRREEDAPDLARHEIYPIIGSPADLSFLESDIVKGTAFDVVVSNTEDRTDPTGHFAQVRAMLDAIFTRDVQKASGSKRPLVMFTSGCKDYGPMKENHGDVGLAPHTEEASPMNPPPTLRPRCSFGTSLLAERNQLFDATVLRPTIVYGHSSSLYGRLFKHAADSNSVLQVIANPNAIMHSVHVDDCAEAYVALAEHPDRDAVAQQAFNISNTHYETAQQVADALASAYGLKVEFSAPDADTPYNKVHGLANFSQWVGSDKVRAVTGWKERLPTFADGIREYRLAYEAFVK